MSPRSDKGIVWGGVIHFPAHPYADMNGMVRAIIRRNNFTQVRESLAKFGVYVAQRDLGHTWFATPSKVEQQASAEHFGELMVCPLPKAYLTVESYSVVPDHFMVREFRK